LFFDTHGEGFLEAMLTLTLEGNDNANDIYDEWTTQVYRALRLQITGDDIANTNSTHLLTVDLYGKWERVVPLNAESNNNNLAQALFHALVTSDLADMAAVQVVTNTNTV